MLSVSRLRTYDPKLTRFAASMNQIGMFDDSTPVNPSVPLLALHRGRIFDSLDFADEKGPRALKGRLIHRESWKVLKVDKEDLERQGPIIRPNSVRRRLRQLVKHMVLTFLFGFAIMTCYSSWAK